MKSNKFYSLTHLVGQIVKDFVLFDSGSTEELPLQKKADIINAVIGWPGFVAVDSANHFIWYDYTIPHKEYGKKTMKGLSRRYAAFTYAWLLCNEDIKKWTMMVHFSKKYKRRIRNLDTRVYMFVGENWLLEFETFDDVLNNQLGKKGQM